MPSDVPTSTPIIAVPSVNTAPMTRRMKDLYQEVASKPDLELVEVISVSGQRLTCRKYGTSATIPNVIMVGWSGSVAPLAGDSVWIMTPQPGSQPFSIGTADPKVPACKVYLNSTGFAADNVFTIIGWGSPGSTEEYDTHGHHDFSTNNSRITIVRPGLYSLQGTVTFQAASGGTRAAYLQINGTNLKTVFENFPSGFFDNTVEVNMHVVLTAGSYVELGYYQNFGSVITLTAGIGKNYLSAVRLAGS